MAFPPGDTTELCDCRAFMGTAEKKKKKKKQPYYKTKASL